MVDKKSPSLEFYNCPLWLADILSRHILPFFENGGYALGERYSVGILFDLKKRPKDEKDVPLGGRGGCYPAYPDRGVITLYIKHLPTMANLVEALFHECDHVLWDFQFGPAGDKYFHLPYAQRPNEIRAISVGEKYKKEMEFSTNDPTWIFFEEEYYKAVE